MTRCAATALVTVRSWAALPCSWFMWLRGLMTHLTEPRFAPALRTLTPPPQYALLWRATLSAAGLFAQLGATVPTRGFHLAYSPGFRGGIPPAQPQRTDGTPRHAS